MLNKKYKLCLFFFGCILFCSILFRANISAYDLGPQMLNRNFEAPFSEHFSEIADMKIQIHNSALNLKKPLLKMNDIVMISIQDIENHFPFEIKKMGNANVITSFYNNNFIKFTTGSKIAFVNGKNYNLQAPVSRAFEDIYIPLVFFMKFNDYKVKYNDGGIQFIPREFKKLHIKEGVQYMYTQLEKFNLAFRLPTHWKRIKSNEFGVWNEYSQYRLTIARELISNGDILLFLQKYKHDIIAEDPNIKFYEENQLTIGNNAYQHFKYERVDEEFTIINDIYLIEFENEAFILTFQYNQENQKYISSEFYDILSSLHKNKVYVNVYEEHYYEFENFYDYNFRLDKGIYSNINVSGTFDFTGSLKLPPNEEISLFAVVEKEGEKLEFDIPTERQGQERVYYNSKLYSPFGLGKHNISILMKKNSAGESRISQKILDFSIINLSANINRYLIPTRYVLSNSMITNSLATFLTVDSKNDYEKVDAVFQYMVDEIKLTRNNTQKTKNSDTIIEEKSANALEFNIAICSILRNLGISSKIYVGEVENKKIYFTEYEINGKTKILDPESQILYNSKREQEIKLSFPFNKYSYFSNLDAQHYKSLLKGFKLLNY